MEQSEHIAWFEPIAYIDQMEQHGANLTSRTIEPKEQHGHIEHIEHIEQVQ